MVRRTPVPACSEAVTESNAVSERSAEALAYRLHRPAHAWIAHRQPERRARTACLVGTARQLWSRAHPTAATLACRCPSCTSCAFAAVQQRSSGRARWLDICGRVRASSRQIQRPVGMSSAHMRTEHARSQPKTPCMSLASSTRRAINLSPHLELPLSHE